MEDLWVDVHKALGKQKVVNKPSIDCKLLSVPLGQDWPVSLLLSHSQILEQVLEHSRYSTLYMIKGPLCRESQTAMSIYAPQNL